MPDLQPRHPRCHRRDAHRRGLGYLVRAHLQAAERGISIEREEERPRLGERRVGLRKLEQEGGIRLRRGLARREHHPGAKQHARLFRSGVIRRRHEEHARFRHGNWVDLGVFRRPAQHEPRRAFGVHAREAGHRAFLANLDRAFGQFPALHLEHALLLTGDARGSGRRIRKERRRAAPP